MPHARLWAMGLLSKVPQRSGSLRRLAKRGCYKHFTKEQKRQMVALHWTPGLTRSWIEYQFERMGLPHEQMMKSLTRIAYTPKYRQRWKHVGERNVLFIGPQEVYYYYTRRNKSRNAWHPPWAVAVLTDEFKRGMKLREIAEKYELTEDVVKHLVYKRSMFDPHVHKVGGNPDWGNKG